MNFKRLLAVGMIVLAMTSANAFAAVDTEIVAPESAVFDTDFDATIKLTGPHSVLAFQVKVAFDTTQLEIVSVAGASSNFSAPGDAAITGANTSGEIDFSYLDTAKFEGFDATAGVDTFVIKFKAKADSGSATITPSAEAIGEAPAGGDVIGTFTPADVALTATPPNPKVMATTSGSGTVLSDSGTETGTPGEKEYDVGATPTYTLTPDDPTVYKVSACTIGGEDVMSSLDCDADTGVCTYQFGALAEGGSIIMSVTFAARALPKVTATQGDQGGLSSDTGTATGNPGEKEYAIGDAPVYTIDPNQGYKISACTVDGEDVMGTLVCSDTDDTCTYTYPPLTEGAVSAINAEFAEEVKPTITLPSDVQNGTIAADIGTLTDNVMEHAVGATPIYTLTPGTGYRVATFTIDEADKKAELTCDDTTNVCTYQFAALAEGSAQTIALTFEAIPYPTITITVGEHGVATSDMGTDTGETGQKKFDIGAEPTYTLDPEDGYLVDTFTVDEADKKAELTCDDTTKVCTYKFAALAEGSACVVAVTFTPDNLSPVATPIENFEVTIGTIPTGQLAGTDEDGTVVSYAIVTQPTKGFLDLTPETGAFTFEPRSSAATGDTDSFTFTVTDDKGAVSEAATVGITFTKTIVAPVAQAMDLAADPTAATTGTLMASDEDGQIVSYTIVTQPLNGMVTLTNAATGEFRLNAFGGATGTDSFTFTATDDDDAVSEAATVNITWGPPNNKPVAVDGMATCEVGKTTVVTLVATDADPTDMLTYEIVAQPASGTVTVAGNVATYTANATAAAGTDTFTFKANDGKEDSDEATITITLVAELPKFDLTAIVTPAAGATITPATLNIAEGEDATFTVEIAEGYELVSVTDNDVEVELNADNTYDLKAIGEAHNIVVTVALMVEGVNSADMNGDFEIELSELLRVQQLYTVGAYHCAAGSEDGYATGDGDQTCAPHSADYKDGADWKIDLSEFLRIIQFYTMLGYHVAPEGEVTEDGFVAGPGE